MNNFEWDLDKIAGLLIATIAVIGLGAFFGVIITKVVKYSVF